MTDQEQVKEWIAEILAGRMTRAVRGELIVQKGFAMVELSTAAARALLTSGQKVKP